MRPIGCLSGQEEFKAPSVIAACGRLKVPSAAAAGGGLRDHEVFEREVSVTGGKREPAVSKEYEAFEREVSATGGRREPVVNKEAIYE